MAKVIYVDDNASAGDDGSSWATAHKYLQDALADAESGDEIWVAEGTYKPDQGAGNTAGDRTASFNLVSGVNLYGGFTGNETNRNPQGDKNQTILSGEIDANSTFWSLHIIKGQNLSYNNTIEGFCIKNSNANGSSSDAYGGGIYLVNSMPYIIDCYFNKCAALNGGGAIYCSGQQQGTIVITDSVFDENSANNGGSIFGNADLTNVVFSENSAYAGGGIYGSYFDVKNSVFLLNAGVFDDTISIASAVSISDWKKSYVSRFSNCLFYNNKNAFMLDGRAYLRNCTFYSDLDDEGYDVSVQLYNHSILPDNQMTLVHSIFWRGNASSNESIFIHNDPLSNLLTNLAATYSYPSNSPDALGLPNLIFGNQGNLGNTITTDPLFKNIDNPIGDDGIWFTKDDGFNLLESSSCIDAGYNSSDYAGGYSSYIQYLPDIDLAGYKRTQGRAVDLGAYEWGEEVEVFKSEEIEDLSNGWWEISWFGAFWGFSDKWIYHSVLGWLYVHPMEDSSYWMWSSEYGWLWISSDYFPYIYQNSSSNQKYANGCWLYLNESNGKLLRYDNQNSKWLDANPLVRMNILIDDQYYFEDFQQIGSEGNAVLSQDLNSFGYDFAGWYVGDQIVSEDINATIYLEQDSDVIGKWQMKDLVQVTINVPNADKQGYMPKMQIINEDGNSSWVEFEVRHVVDCIDFKNSSYHSIWVEDFNSSSNLSSLKTEFSFRYPKNENLKISFLNEIKHLVELDEWKIFYNSSATGEPSVITSLFGFHRDLDILVESDLYLIAETTSVLYELNNADNNETGSELDGGVVEAVLEDILNGSGGHSDPSGPCYCPPDLLVDCLCAKDDDTRPIHLEEATPNDI